MLLHIGVFICIWFAFQSGFYRLVEFDRGQKTHDHKTHDVLTDHEESYNILPFGFNTSQKDAVVKALRNKISIIEGPPGTGKTQTILNIIANAIINEKCVAVVSNNNSATKNVIDKLKKYNVDFIAAYLGKKSNKEDFIASQGNAKYKNIKNWIIEDFKVIEIQEELKSNFSILTEKLSQKIN